MKTSFWQKRRNGALSECINYGHQDDAIALLKKGADFDTAPGHWKNPLYQAIAENCPMVVDALLSHGANPNPPELTGDSPLLLALAREKLQAASRLVGTGANLAARNADGQTPLLVAARLGAGELVIQMVDKGAEVNAQGPDGNTALHIAAEKGFGNIVRYLLDHGADPKQRNGNLNSAAEVSERTYPRIALMIRGVAPPEAPAAPVKITVPAAIAATGPAPEAAKPATVKESATKDPEEGAWRLTAANEVALVLERHAIGYRLTEIFNFGSGVYTRLARSMETGAESQAVRFFDEFTDRALLDRAQAALVKLGGEVPETAPPKALDKPVLPAPGGPK